MLTFSISKIRCKIIISLGGTRLSLPVIAALLLAGCGSIDEARTASAAAKTPKVVDVQVLALAEEAIKQKRYKDAKSLIQRILLYDAKNKKAQVLWAEFLLATGKPRDGIKFFEANKDDPALSARALQGMGLAQLWMGENEKAKEHLKQAVAKDPTLWRAWNALG